MVDEESIIEGEGVGPPEIVGRDILESYVIAINHTPINPLDRYATLVKSITFGIELLPSYDDEDKQNEINTLYADSKKALKEEIPSKREIKFSYTDDGNELHPVYKISAYEDIDAKKCDAQVGELSTILNNFVTMQHESHIGKLQDVHNRILHELTEQGIVPVLNPTYAQMKEEMKKQRLRDRLGGA